MFGWEFPPHISGGLGTACFGLSKALLEQHVKLLFVVPKAYGDESIDLINASAVMLGKKNPVVDILAKKKTVQSRIIIIPSSLKPYALHESCQVLEEWDWQFPSGKMQFVKTKEGVRYDFKGGYGPSLMAEVDRYAKVASVIARQQVFDCIHAHDWLTYPAGMEAKKVSGKPLIVHVHATEYDRAGKDQINQHVYAIEKTGMSEADKVIAVSQWTKDIIVQKYGINPAKVAVVHNGVMPGNETAISALSRISHHVITFLGRITYQKGPQYFIEAARKVLDYLPDAHFIMAGAGDLLPAMIDKVAQLKLSSRIHFTGFLKEYQVRQVWSVTDVYVMPSVSEPFGITPLEAAQAGVPVIVSNQSGVAEVMDHAVKVDFWDVNALADAIINILTQKGLSRAMKSNSHKELNELTWERAAIKVNKLYHEL